MQNFISVTLLNSKPKGSESLLSHLFPTIDYRPMDKEPLFVMIELADILKKNQSVQLTCERIQGLHHLSPPDVELHMLQLRTH